MKISGPSLAAIDRESEIYRKLREAHPRIANKDASTWGSKAAAEAALTGKTEVFSLVDNRGREVIVASAKLAYVEFGAPEGARKLGFGS